MTPLIFRSWVTEGDRIGVKWHILGIPVWGKAFLPWEVPGHLPWSYPQEAEDLHKKQSGDS